MVQSIRVTNATSAGLISSLEIDDRGKKSRLQIQYDMAGVISGIDASGVRLTKSEMVDLVQNLGFSQAFATQDKLLNIKKSPLEGRVVSNDINFTERWEWLTDQPRLRDYFFNQYTGRSYPFSPCWLSEVGTNPDSWPIPKFKIGAGPTGEPPKMRNVIDLTNTKDGSTIDEVYVQPRKAYAPPCMMRITCKLPDPAGVPGGTELLFGFEINSQGGAAIYSFYVENGFVGIKTKCMIPTGQHDAQTAAVLVTPTQFMEYHLDYEPPYLRLFQYSGGVRNLLATCTIVGATADDYVSPFATNESSTIVSGYEVGHWAVWQRKKKMSNATTGTYTGDAVANKAIPHGLGSIPSLVLISRRSDGQRHFRLYAGWARIFEVTLGETLAVTGMNATNFYVGNAADFTGSANQNTIPYYWAAIP